MTFLILLRSFVYTQRLYHPRIYRLDWPQIESDHQLHWVLLGKLCSYESDITTDTHQTVFKLKKKNPSFLKNYYSLQCCKDTTEGQCTSEDSTPFLHSSSSSPGSMLSFTSPSLTSTLQTREDHQTQKRNSEVSRGQFLMSSTEKGRKGEEKWNYLVQLRTQE